MIRDRESLSGHNRGQKTHKLHKRVKRVITFSTWNIRTLGENSGSDRRICRSRPGPHPIVPACSTSPHCVDRKLDFLIKELKRLGVAVAGIQETRWFGSDVWTAADGYMLLHSGRPLPEESAPQTRNEGVGIMLDKDGVTAWKDAGECWEAVSSRVVTARLKVARNGQRRPGGARETSDSFMTVVSAYAPTAKAPPNVKDKFFEELQDTLDGVPTDDILILLGDFNVRVGRRVESNDVCAWETRHRDIQ